MKGVKRLSLMLVASVMAIITLWGGTGTPKVQLVRPGKAERRWVQAVFAHWPAHTPVRVDVFGGSIAAGWVDNAGGYIDRALRGWAAASGIHVRLLVRAVPGMAIVDMRTKFNQIVTKTKPNWVILSWGGLNDAVAHKIGRAHV